MVGMLRFIFKSLVARKPQWRKVWNSMRGHQLASACANIKDEVLRMTKEQDQLAAKSIPGFKTEFVGNDDDTSEFECTFVRTQFSGMTRLYDHHSTSALGSVLNDFYLELIQIIARYGGLVNEFSPEGATFYFKDEDVGNSAAVAVSAVRDMNEIARKRAEELTRKCGHSFTLRTSLAHGDVRFEQIVNRFRLLGPAVTESLAALAYVRERDQNVVVYDRRHLDLIGEIATSKTYEVDGASHPNLVTYVDHQSLNKLLSGGQKESPLDSSKYYRSDEDLSHIFKWAKTSCQEGQLTSVSTVIGYLRQTPPTQIRLETQVELASWLTDTLHLIQSQIEDDKNLKRVFASAITLIENFSDAATFNEVFEPLLQASTKVRDRRVVANALDVLTYFKSADDPAFSRELMKHEDNRVAGNALVHVGSRQLSPLVVVRLQTMLESGKAPHMASSLYALGELAAYHRARDLAQYNAHISFLRVVQMIPKYVQHSEAMVRRQAFIAARKCEDEKIISAVREIVAKAKGALDEEAREHLDGMTVPADIKKAA